MNAVVKFQHCCFGRLVADTDSAILDEVKFILGELAKFEGHQILIRRAFKIERGIKLADTLEVKAKVSFRFSANPHKLPIYEEQAS